MWESNPGIIQSRFAQTPPNHFYTRATVNFKTDNAGQNNTWSLYHCALQSHFSNKDHANILQARRDYWWKI